MREYLTFFIVEKEGKNEIIPGNLSTHKHKQFLFHWKTLMDLLKGGYYLSFKHHLSYLGLGDGNAHNGYRLKSILQSV